MHASRAIGVALLVASLTSVPASAAGVAPRNAAPPTFSDSTPHDLDRQRAYAGGWSGSDPIEYSFRWQRCSSLAESSCAPIAGATSADYTQTASDIGSRMRVRVTATNSAGSATAVSAASGPVAAARPHNTSLPAVTGTPTDGAILGVSKGSWTGTTPMAWSYTWRRCDAAGASCTTLPGSAATFALRADHVGYRIRVSVTASNAGGSSSATSAASAAVTALAPAVATPPALVGNAQLGQALSAAPGTWSGSGPITHRYAWERCDASGGGCAAVAGATGKHHTLGAADVGRRLRVAVTASNARGATTARTAPSPVVLAQGVTLMGDEFTAANGPNNLITNQYASFTSEPDAVLSPLWLTTAGSLFSRAGTGWSGAPDDRAPNATSSAGTGSAIFRMHSRETFGDVIMTLDLRINGYVATPSTPDVEWDGVHLWVRHVSQYELYYASVNRRDGLIVIKKKCPGGTSNGGTYHMLTPQIPYATSVGTWQDFAVSAQNVPGGVELVMYADGVLRQRIVDRGVGCAPISEAGAVGVRGDNADVQLDWLTIRGIDSAR